MSTVHPPPLFKSLVVVGCVDGALLQSDRAAVGLATSLDYCDVSVCCPDNDEISLRYAIAAGATGVVPLNEAVADIYVIGRGGTGIPGELMPAKLALAVNATLVLDVLNFELQTDGIRVVRDLGRGSREIMVLSLPVVLVISNNAKTPAYISRYRQMSVSAVLKGDASNPSGSSPESRWQPLRRRTRIGDLALKTEGDAKDRMFTAFGLVDESDSATNGGHIISADPETCTSHLIRYLAHHGFVDSRLKPADDLLEPVTNYKENDSGDSPAAQRKIDAGFNTRWPAKLARRPRPYGEDISAKVRGPFTVQED